MKGTWGVGDVWWVVFLLVQILMPIYLSSGHAGPGSASGESAEVSDGGKRSGGEGSSGDPGGEPSSEACPRRPDEAGEDGAGSRKDGK